MRAFCGKTTRPRERERARESGACFTERERLIPSPEALPQKRFVLPLWVFSAPQNCLERLPKPLERPQNPFAPLRSACARVPNDFAPAPSAFALAENACALAQNALALAPRVVSLAPKPFAVAPKASETRFYRERPAPLGSETADLIHENEDKTGKSAYTFDSSPPVTSPPSPVPPLTVLEWRARVSAIPRILLSLRAHRTPLPASPRQWLPWCVLVSGAHVPTRAPRCHLPDCILHNYALASHPCALANTDARGCAIPPPHRGPQVRTRELHISRSHLRPRIDGNRVAKWCAVGGGGAQVVR